MSLFFYYYASPLTSAIFKSPDKTGIKQTKVTRVLLFSNAMFLSLLQPFLYLQNRRGIKQVSIPCVLVFSVTMLLSLQSILSLQIRGVSSKYWFPVSLYFILLCFYLYISHFHRLRWNQENICSLLPCILCCYSSLFSSVIFISQDKREYQKFVPMCPCIFYCYASIFTSVIFIAPDKRGFKQILVPHALYFLLLCFFLYFSYFHSSR